MTNSLALNGYTYGFHSGPDNRTFLLLHGVGGDESAMNQIGKLLAPDSNWLSPKGPVISDGHARYFTRQPDASFDSKEVTEQTAAMATFIRAALAAHQLESTELIAVGYSNGANLIASLLAQQPGLFSRAVLYRAMLPIDFTNQPNLTKARVLMLNGSNDFIMDHKRVNSLAAYLKTCGADTTQHWLPAGHPLTPEDIARTAHWLAS
jgi:phospholipase/carboxylesterase